MKVYGPIAMTIKQELDLRAREYHRAVRATGARITFLDALAEVMDAHDRTGKSIKRVRHG